MIHSIDAAVDPTQSHKPTFTEMRRVDLILLYFWACYGHVQDTHSTRSYLIKSGLTGNLADDFAIWCVFPGLEASNIT